MGWADGFGDVRANHGQFDNLRSANFNSDSIYELLY